MAARQERAADAAPRPAGTKPDLVFTRVIDAPRDLVWQAWTKPEHLAQWFGPKGFTVSESEMELRPGGALRIVMRSPEGQDFANTGVVREVVPPERLVFTTALLNAAGAPILEDLNTLTLATQGTKTKLTLNARVTRQTEEAEPMVAGMDDGWNQTLDRLEQHVATRALVIRRTFDAPPDLVWKAFSTSEGLPQWWGPKGFTTRVEKLEFRPGGIFHYRMRSGDGQGPWGWFVFVYREIVAPERIVFINSFSDEQGNITRAPFSSAWPLEMLNTLTLEEIQGRTTVTLVVTPGDASEVEREAFTAARDSMQQGFNGAFGQLEAYLAGRRENDS